MGKTVNGKSPEVSGIFSTDPLVNLEHFDTNFMGAADCGYIVSTDKPVKKWILRGWKLRGLTWNRINTLSFIYENDQRNKINIFSDSESVTPTHIGAAHTFSKIRRKFQNRNPKESDQNIDFSRISIIHWSNSNFSK